MPVCDIHGEKCSQASAQDYDEDLEPSNQGPVTLDEGDKDSAGSICSSGQAGSRKVIYKECGKPTSKKWSLKGDIEDLRGVKFEVEDGWSVSRGGEEKGLLLERWTIEARKRV